MMNGRENGAAVSRVFGDKIRNMREKTFRSETDNLAHYLSYAINLDKTTKERSSILVPGSKLVQFLSKVLEWEPAWLEDQIKHPPVVDGNLLKPIPSKFASYSNYYAIIQPLLALEIWEQLSRDLDVEKNQHCVRVPTTAFLTRFPDHLWKCSLSSLEFSATLSEGEVKKFLEPNESRNSKKQDQHELFDWPDFGDLVILKLKQTVKGKKCYSKAFAFVEDVGEPKILKFQDSSNNHLPREQRPYATLAYTMAIKPINPADRGTKEIRRIIKVSYLRSSLRMIEALDYLRASPLSSQILSPKLKDFELPEMTSFDPASLVTKDVLNTRQIEAVVRVRQAIESEMSKICLIQGPPGTGKSKVIANLVMELIYGGGNKSYRKLRILLCAPSNAAIDHLVLRLLEIQEKLPESTRRFKMVRMGRLENMHPDVQKISLDKLVKKFEKEVRLLTGKIQFVQDAIEKAERDGSVPTRLLEKLSKYKKELDLLQDGECFEAIDPLKRKRMEREADMRMLLEADVIASTLTSCHTKLMETTFGGELGVGMSVCIVDEATQCVEAETLIPLMLGVRTLVLVGDTNQLPATVLSQKAKKFGLDKSLFARIQSCFSNKDENPVIQLNMQYRMSPPVALWPNKFFYDGLLINSANVESLPFHFYKVLDHDGPQNRDKFSNNRETALVVNVLHTLMDNLESSRATSPVNVGIITPYNNQKVLINKRFQKCIDPLPGDIKSRITYEVNTVDSFQGQERDIIIMSCVRSEGIGFLSDRHRLCVALTRAKHSVILCGNFKTFEKDRMWNALLTDAKSRGAYQKIPVKTLRKDMKQYIVLENDKQD